MKIIEIFESLQGEGPRIGVPSLFIRFCGCNMRCKFNCFNKEEEQEVENKWNEIKKNDSLKQLKDYPMLGKGCDSYPAIIPEIYNKLATYYTVDELINIIRNTNCQDIVFTGGEPFLWWNDIYKVLIKKNKDELNPLWKENKNFWFETNGTSKKIEDLCSHPNLKNRMNIVMSPKIEYMTEEQKKQFEKNISYFIFNPNFYVKLVISDVKKIEEYIMYFKENGHYVNKEKLYFMPEGDTYSEEFLERSKAIAEECIKQGVKFSFRLHNLLWKNEWGK